MTQSIRAISTPSVIVNGEIFPIIPNSLKIVSGFGTAKVRTESLGGRAINIVTTQDATTFIGKITFKMTCTAANIARIQATQQTISENLVQFTDIITGVGGSISNASITNDPEYMMSVDGEVEVTIEGAPVVNS